MPHNVHRSNCLTVVLREGRRQNESVLLRLFPVSVWSTELTAGWQNWNYKAAFLENAGYSIDGWEIKSLLAWQPNLNLRLTAELAHKERYNKLPPAESAVLNELQLNAKWVQKSSGSLLGRFRWVDIAYTGQAESAAGYQLLEALQPGMNQTWELNYTQRLKNNLQLTMGYSGRNSVNAPVTHIGRMQAALLF